ncbi:MAG: carbon storage regulator [Isosphaeraceae bacterium]|nr:carbon storage regulator [Isosphaeraceae bacterium]
MLVLSRKRLEGIMVGEEVRITVVKIDRNHVRIGIEAPDDVMVVREELTHDAEYREARDAWDSAEVPTAVTPTPESTEAE